MILERRSRGEVVPVDWTRKERLSEHSDGLCSGHANAWGGDTLPRQPAGLSSRGPTQRQRDLAGKEEYNGRASPLRLVRLRRTRSGPRTCPEISFRDDLCSGSGAARLGQRPRRGLVPIDDRDGALDNQEFYLRRSSL